MKELKEIKNELKELKAGVEKINKALYIEDDGPEKEILEMINHWQFKIIDIVEAAKKKGLDSPTTISALEGLRRKGELFEPKRGVIQALR